MLLKKKLVIKLQSSIVYFKRDIWPDSVIIKCELCIHGCRYPYTGSEYPECRICTNFRNKFTGKTDEFAYVIEKIQDGENLLL